ncbi:multiple epidermal growth factor-like domains protein 10 [Saccostrea echinata]|uniref:multiple epidermal growth factor-like domains protein 10 n=1 Tax=Saccostrea echinata TaxID=191078 RepID=UPI002A7F2DAA|nr:multiple epidermal growth factor-like domains protein 10 [Saccostrea echinata]
MITLEIVSLRHLSQGGRCWSTGNAYYTPENLAFRKTTWQSTSHDATISGPERAVDGLKKDRSYLGRQCSVSSVHQITASWWVNLGGILSINNILIYYRTDNMPWNENNIYTTRFLGFSVYISNTTDRNGGISCFNDTNYTKFTIPDHVNISCPTYGQYVIYYNERLQGVSYPDDYYPYAFVELCEVEVYGCPIPGYYGSDCSLPCPDSNCRYCHIQSGVCVGCEFGYQGHQCEQQCNQSFYGELCSEKCGNFTDIRTCNHVNGTCTNGCDVGVYGDKCKIACPVGWHGHNCSQMCSNCDQCDRLTGQCTSPCYPGWKGLFCRDECDGGRHGQDCEQRCGACLGYKQCHHINGSCLEGCDAGFEGELCTTGCSSGKFGINCEEVCNDKCGEPNKCNGTTGECEGGCQPGWEGLHCKNGNIYQSPSVYQH